MHEMFTSQQLELLLSLSTKRDVSDGMRIGLRRAILDGWNSRLIGVHAHTLEEAVNRLKSNLDAIERVYKDNLIPTEMTKQHIGVLFYITNKRELTDVMRLAIFDRLIYKKKYKEITNKYMIHRQSIALAISRLEDKHAKISKVYLER